VDDSAEMLGRAERRLAALDAAARHRVTLIAGDMRDWSGTGAAFDAVLIGGDSGFVPVGRTAPYLITLARRPAA
jgi:hypothetical protein